MDPKEISWLREYPHEYLWLVENNIVKLAPWYLLNAELAQLRYEGLRERYPGLSLFAFAARYDCDDIACWEDGALGRVVVVHDFASQDYLRRRNYSTFWDWFRSAMEDMIERAEGDS